MSHEIEVLQIRKLSGNSSLKAFVSLRLGGITIHSCRIIQQSGKQAWVSMPQNELAPKEGETKKRYFPIVELSESLKERVSVAILEQWSGGSE